MATASINEAIFNVAGGNLEIEGLLVENITTRGDIIRTSSGSVSSITNATFRGNTITRVSKIIHEHPSVSHQAMY